MKEAKRKIFHTMDTVYICEICKKEYLFREDCVRCEKAHGCTHKEFIYSFVDGTSDSWWFNVKAIKKECEYCGTEMGEVDLEDVEGNNKILGLIYESIKKLEGENETEI